MNTADILFVVDDSGSMASNQKNLADNFGTFIAELAKTQKDRADRGLQALDFHIAITTSSVYENFPAAGNAACASTPQGPQCTFRSYADGSVQTYACTGIGEGCGDLITRYSGFGAGGTHPGCTPGVGVEGQPYPAGDFVAAGGNPKVLHFTKDLGWSTWGTASADPKLTDLVAKFQQNIAVGTCGSGQEQHLEGARLAIQKALRQNGKTQPADVPASEFPHTGAKLVVDFVGDEDDCSGPADPNKAVQTNSAYDVQDTCVQDWRLPDSATRKEFATTSYVDFLTGLGRPVGAAFIFSSSCTVDATGKKVCQPGLCGCTTAAGQPADPATCGGKSSGTRMKEVATALEGRGVGVVEASVCDASFATTLQSIAQLVKPPAGLQLPSQPAANEVAVLRIVNGSGNTARIRKVRPRTPTGGSSTATTPPARRSRRRRAVSRSGPDCRARRTPARPTRRNTSASCPRRQRPIRSADAPPRRSSRPSARSCSAAGRRTGRARSRAVSPAGRACAMRPRDHWTGCGAHRACHSPPSEAGLRAKVGVTRRCGGDDDRTGRADGRDAADREPGGDVRGDRGGARASDRDQAEQGGRWIETSWTEASPAASATSPTGSPQSA